MGQNRKDGQGSPGRIDFFEELSEDAALEKLIGYREMLVATIIIFLVVIRETLYPSHLYLIDILSQ